MSIDNPDIREVSGRHIHVGIVAAYYNSMLVESLLKHTMASLALAGASAPIIERVPGAAELPYAVDLLADCTDVVSIIALGVVVAGDTKHHDIIGNSTARALHEISIYQKIPVINGILVVDTIEQAQARIDGTINRGKEFALAALEMAQLKKRWETTNK